MRRHLFTIGIVALLSGPAIAGSIGVADSTGSFDIHREGEVLAASVGSAALRDGDTIVTEKQSVKVQEIDGSIVLVGQRSELNMNEDEVRLSRGAVALHPSANGKTRRVSVDGLVVEAAGGKNGSKLIAVERVGENTVRVRNVGGSYQVRNASTSEAAEFESAAGEVRTFERRDGAWSTSDSTVSSLDTVGGGRGGDSEGVAIAYFDFPGDDDLEISTSGDDIGGRSALDQHENPNPVEDWLGQTQGGRQRN